MLDRYQLNESIREWQQWLKGVRRRIIPRSTSLKVPSKNALALTGVRRGGKSWSAVEISQQWGEGLFYYNFEDPLFIADSNVLNLDELISVYTEHHRALPKLVIFDEIQNVPGWERWMRKAIDLDRFKIIVTGSSAKLLSSEISTSLAGRVIEKNIWPLSFSEFLKFTGRSCDSPDAYLGELRRYLDWGGFPEVSLLENDEERKDLLRQYFNDIVLKDVMSRHEIRTKRVLDQLLIYYFSNISSLHSYSSIKKAFGINTSTTAEYTSYCSDAFLLFEVNRYHLNLKVQSRDPKKIYAIDTGIRNVHSVAREHDLGKLAENAAYIHLRRLGKEVSYFKEKGEVDFLITELGYPKSAIQVCYSDLAEPATYQREVDSLLECLKGVDLPEGTILTLKREETRTLQGKKVIFLPLYRWLLQ